MFQEFRVQGLWIRSLVSQCFDGNKDDRDSRHSMFGEQGFLSIVKSIIDMGAGYDYEVLGNVGNPRGFC